MNRMSYLELCASLLVWSAFDFSDHNKTGVVIDNVDATENRFCLCKRSFDLVWPGNVKLDDKELFSRVAGLKIGQCNGRTESCHDLVTVLERCFGRCTSNARRSAYPGGFNSPNPFPGCYDLPVTAGPWSVN